MPDCAPDYFASPYVVHVLPCAPLRVSYYSHALALCTYCGARPHIPCYCHLVTRILVPLLGLTIRVSDHFLIYFAIKLPPSPSAFKISMAKTLTHTNPNMWLMGYDTLWIGYVQLFVFILHTHNLVFCILLIMCTLIFLMCEDRFKIQMFTYRTRIEVYSTWSKH